MVMHMNEWEVAEYAQRYMDHRTLGPAIQTLTNLVVWTNGHSDGWAYWQKPGRAAERLMTLIRGEYPSSRYDDERADVTEDAYKKALVPIKAFRTREKADFRIVEVGQPLQEPRTPTEYERELKQLLLDWIDKSLTVISEFGGSSDWPELIEDAERRARILGVEWTRAEMPDYVKTIMAIED